MDVIDLEMAVTNEHFQTALGTSNPSALSETGDGGGGNVEEGDNGGGISSSGGGSGGDVGGSGVEGGHDGGDGSDGDASGGGDSSCEGDASDGGDTGDDSGGEGNEGGGDDGDGSGYDASDGDDGSDDSGGGDASSGGDGNNNSEAGGNANDGGDVGDGNGSEVGVVGGDGGDGSDDGDVSIAIDEGDTGDDSCSERSSDVGDASDGDDDGDDSVGGDGSGNDDAESDANNRDDTGDGSGNEVGELDGDGSGGDASGGDDGSDDDDGDDGSGDGDAEGGANNNGDVGDGSGGEIVEVGNDDSGDGDAKGGTNNGGDVGDGSGGEIVEVGSDGNGDGDVEGGANNGGDVGDGSGGEIVEVGSDGDIKNDGNNGGDAGDGSGDEIVEVGSDGSGGDASGGDNDSDDSGDGDGGDVSGGNGEKGGVTTYTRFPWDRAARWIIGVSIPLIAGSATIVSTRSRGITFDVFNLFTNGLSFLLLLLATIILRTPFPTLTPSLFIRIVGLHILEPLLAQTSLSVGAQFLPAQFNICLASVVPTLTYVMSIIFRIQLLSIRKKSSQAKLGGLIITLGGACLIGVYNGPIITAHRVVNENWTWPVVLVVVSILCSACHNVLLETTMEKYDVEALWLATIVRFSGVIPSLIIALVTTDGRTYKWVMGWDFNTFCWVFSGICAGLVQYLGTNLTKKTDAVFASSFSPISMILVIVLSAMIFHDTIKKPSMGGVVMIVIGLCMFHWGEYRSTSEEEARAEDERLRRRLELGSRFELIRRSLMYVQEEHYV